MTSIMFLMLVTLYKIGDKLTINCLCIILEIMKALILNWQVLYVALITIFLSDKYLWPIWKWLNFCLYVKLMKDVDIPGSLVEETGQESTWKILKHVIVNIQYIVSCTITYCCQQKFSQEILISLFFFPCLWSTYTKNFLWSCSTYDFVCVCVVSFF